MKLLFLNRRVHRVMSSYREYTSLMFTVRAEL